MNATIKRIFLSSIIWILIFSALADVVQATDESNTEKAGDILTVVIPASAYATTFFLDDNDGRNQFYKSFFTNVGVSFALKYAINKPRPENNGNYSFPSGHTSSAFQGATFIYRRYGFKYSVPAYAFASFVGWSRIESDEHDYTDVAAGALIGVLSSYYFTSPYKDLTITPSASNNSFGISISYKW